MDREIKEIRLEDIVSFKCHSGRTYEGERLQQLMDSIKEIGLLSPIIVRPIDDWKYEVICGHNRIKAVEALGHGSIRAEVRYGISDDRALELFYDSNLNQQSFSDWSYAQKFDAIRYSEPSAIFWSYLPCQEKKELEHMPYSSAKRRGSATIPLLLYTFLSIIGHMPDYLFDYLLIFQKTKNLRNPIKSRILRIFPAGEERIELPCQTSYVQ